MAEAGAHLGETIGHRLAPIADLRTETGTDIVIDNAGAALRGCFCVACEAVAFPVRDACMACGARDMSPAQLPTTGTLYAFTVVHVAPARATPYAIGYVDLSNGVRLLSVLEGAADQLVLDAEMTLVVRGDEWMFARVAGVNL